ncbi:MAG: hypothetical protein ACYDBJ_04340 [Aggregatilineales bacterium]
MSNSTTADWLALTLLLNRQAFRQPPVENWLHSFLEALSERIPAIDGIQVVQGIGNAAVTPASSGQVPPALNDQATFDADSPVTRALNTRERQIASDLRAYPILYGDDAIGVLVAYSPGLPSDTDDILSAIAAQLGPALAQQASSIRAAALENARLSAQAADRIQIEQLRSQIETGLSAGDVTTLVLETTQGIGRALNARRARVRFMPPSEENAR